MEMARVGAVAPTFYLQSDIVAPYLVDFAPRIRSSGGVPATNLLGEEGRGFTILMTELAQERLVQAIRAVAFAEAALEWTIQYCKDRDMFGKTLADFQNTQFVLAQLHSDVLAQRVFVDRCLELHMAGQLDAVDAAKVKMTTTQLQGREIDECVQLFGGWGYMTEYPIARDPPPMRLIRSSTNAVVQGRGAPRLRAARRLALASLVLVPAENQVGQQMRFKHPLA